MSALGLRDGSKEVNLPWQRNWKHRKYMHMALRYCLCPKRLSHKLSVSTSLPDSQGALGFGSGGAGQPPLLIRQEKGTFLRSDNKHGEWNCPFCSSLWDMVCVTGDDMMLRTLSLSPDPRVPGPAPWLSHYFSLQSCYWCYEVRDGTLPSPGHPE